MTPAAGVPASRWPRAAEAGLTFRLAADADLPFLARVYAATRTDELAAVPWSDSDKAAFLDMQFRAQHGHYRAHHPDAERLVAACGGRDVGRLYLDRRADQHRIIDIALLPGHRGRGLGTALLRDLTDEAGAAGKAVSLHVEKTNPALRLYLRLGFVRAADAGVHDLMRWHAVQPNTAS